MQVVTDAVAIDRQTTRAISRQRRLEGLTQSRVRKPLAFHTGSVNSAVHTMCLLLLTESHSAFRAIRNHQSHHWSPLQTCLTYLMSGRDLLFERWGELCFLVVVSQSQWKWALLSEQETRCPVVFPVNTGCFSLSCVLLGVWCMERRSVPSFSAACIWELFSMLCIRVACQNFTPSQISAPLCMHVQGK